jgi:Uma2 family endonuclease
MGRTDYPRRIARRQTAGSGGLPALASRCRLGPGTLHSPAMSVAPRRMHYTLADYSALEAESSVRHEYLGGDIFAMAGGTPDHAALAATVLRLVGAGLPPGCRTYTSDLCIRIPATGLSTYADGTVVCGKTLRAEDDPLAVVNPVLLVEVTSRSSEEYDRGAKLQHYQALPSTREVLIVSHREPWLTLHRREAEGSWSVTEARAGGSVHLDAAGVRLQVDDVYRDGLEDAV